MKFKLDENLPVEAPTLLREAGHDAFNSFIRFKFVDGKPSRGRGFEENADDLITKDIIREHFE